ncbi:unnamed protein product [Prorocentrum cordatum]|uniref:Uncharacterized protein n=1 Tax=Prorocentrum cordatum TaxID=2364126 RepID=A0ABN9W166_9DINO|nr:unnamed protein product [Polarella glacialis]
MAIVLCHPGFKLSRAEGLAPPGMVASLCAAVSAAAPGVLRELARGAVAEAARVAFAGPQACPPCPDCHPAPCPACPSCPPAPPCPACVCAEPAPPPVLAAAACEAEERPEWWLLWLVALVVAFFAAPFANMSTRDERRPGARLLVRFVGDEWAHERVLLWPVHLDRRHECWVIESADGDRYVERRADWVWHVSLLHGWPENFRGNGEEPTSMVDWHGDECGLDIGVLEAARRRLRGKRPLATGARVPESPGDEAASRPVLAPPPLEGEESVLLVAEVQAGGGFRLGDEVAPGPEDVQAGPKVIARRPDGRPVLCERVPVSEVERWRAQEFDNAGRMAAPLPAPLSPPPAEEAGRPSPFDLREALADRPREEVGGTPTPREETAGPAADDVRTTAVEWNEQGVRFKEWRRAVGESSSEALDGCELRGAGTALHLCHRFTQHGGDPKTWMSNFCREYGVSQRDRTWHELNCLVTIFWLVATFDALNLGGLACLEVAARRVAQISEAYRVAPGQPAALEAGRFLTGTSDPFDVVSPELRNFANRAARDESERLAALGRSRALGPGGRGAGGADEVTGALETVEMTGKGPGVRPPPGLEAEATLGGQVYPVPGLRELDADVASRLGRRDRPRVRRLANEGLSSLNWMRGADRRPPPAAPSWATRCRVAELRRETQRRAQLLAASWGGPDSAKDSQQCLARLLRGRGGYAQLAHATLTPFSHARLSTPDDLAGSPRVLSLLSEAARIQLKDFESYMHAASPPGVDLVSGGGLSRVERGWPPGDGESGGANAALAGLDTWLGVSDVKDCFHRLLLEDGPGLQEYFGHPPLRAADLRLTELDGARLAPSTLVYPLARALPMGWAWSLFFAQSANSCRMLKVPSLQGAPVMTDRGPPLILDRPSSMGHYAYVDNMGVLGTTEGAVRRGLEGAISSFGGVGLEVHETAVTNEGGEALGVQLDADWDARWLLGVYQSDASLDGVGLAYSVWGPKDVGRVGRVTERSRYRLVAEAARQRAVEAAGLQVLADGAVGPPEARPPGIPEVEVARWSVDPDFEEVPAELLRRDRWRTVLADRWAFDEGIVHLEGRAVVKAVERVASSRAGRDGRVLLLGDNMAVTLAFSRSRARDFKLLTMIRRTAACAFARGLRFSYRWIPSEFNGSDEGGRIRPPSRAARARVLTRGLLAQGPAPSQPAAQGAQTGPPGLPPGCARGRRAASRGRSPRRARRLSREACSGLAKRASAGPVPRPSCLEQAPQTERGRAAANPFRDAKAAAATAASAEGDSESSCEEELPSRGSAQADARRAAARVRRMAFEELPPGQTYLEAHSVKAATRARYQTHVGELVAYADKISAPLGADAEVDDCIVRWVNDEFRAGRRAWRGESTLASVMFVFPAFSCNGWRKLVWAFRCLKGWRTLSPPMSRRPLPWPVWAALALQLMRMGFGLAAVAVLVMVEACLRPSELLSLQRRSLLPPARGGLTRWGLFLFPSRAGVARSKTGEADDTVVMDSTRTPWLDHVFEHLSQGPGEERIFPWDYSQFYQMFCAAAKSVARYEKAGRLNDAWRELSSEQQAHALDCERLLEALTPFFAELFSGAGRVAAAARRVGYCSREWGIKAGPAGNVLRQCVEAGLCASILAGLVLAVMLAPPCTSFSVVQNVNVPLRSATPAAPLQRPSRQPPAPYPSAAQALDPTLASRGVVDVSDATAEAPEQVQSPTHHRLSPSPSHEQRQGGARPSDSMDESIEKWRRRVAARGGSTTGSLQSHPRSASGPPKTTRGASLLRGFEG